MKYQILLTVHRMNPELFYRATVNAGLDGLEDDFLTWNMTDKEIDCIFGELIKII